MTQSNNSIKTPIQPLSLGKRMAVGAGIGLLLIALFLLGVKEPNPAWGKLWMVRPLIIVPLAGAMGGLCNYVSIQFHTKVGVSRLIAVVVSVLVGIIGLWLGIVLGLDGTLWD